MKICEECGFSATDDAAFCTNCGSSFRQSDQIISDNMKVCPSCGMPMANSVANCNNCGYVFRNIQAQSHQQSILSSTTRSGTVSPVPPTTFDSPTTSIKHYPVTASGGTVVSEKENHTIFWIILIILIVAVLALSSILVYNLVFSDSDQVSTATIETQEFSADDVYVNTEESIPDHTPKYEKVSDYYVYASNSTWEQANSSAKQMGGELVCIENAEEFRKVCQLAEKNNMISFWIGMKRTTDNWQQSHWNDGSDFEYSPWYNTEPTYIDENGVQERYLMAFKVNGVWYFNDAVNDVAEHYSGKMGYIVETVTEVEIEE